VENGASRCARAKREPEREPEPEPVNVILGYCVNGYDALGQGKRVKVHDALSLRMRNGGDATFKAPPAPKAESRDKNGSSQIGCSRCRHAINGCDQCNPEHRNYGRKTSRTPLKTSPVTESGNAALSPNSKPPTPNGKPPPRVWAGSPQVFIPRRRDTKRSGTMQIGDYAAATFQSPDNSPYIFFGLVEELRSKKQKIESCSLEDAKVKQMITCHLTPLSPS